MNIEITDRLPITVKKILTWDEKTRLWEESRQNISREMPVRQIKFTIKGISAPAKNRTQFTA